MGSNVTDAQTQVAEGHEGAGDVLLDLGDYAPAGSEDDFVLDIDLNEVQEPSPLESAYQASAFVSRSRYRSSGRGVTTADWSKPGVPSGSREATTDQLATTEEFNRPGFQPPQEPARQEEYGQASMPVENQQSMAGSSNASTMDSGSESRSASLQQLSPEMIDAIARRAVEQLSEKVVQEIAWEVVPQLAELMIKRQLEEKNS
jgi:hypothetical protein